MTINEINSVIVAMVGTFGGTSLIIIALSGWLAKVWANRILEKDKIKYAEELETIKQKIQNESDRQKLIFSLYFKGQFKLYNDLWLSLVNLKNKVDALWNEASNANLREFIDSIKEAKKQIESKALLIEKEHYDQFVDIFNQFENYKLGKERLIQRQSLNNASNYDIGKLIRDNSSYKERIELLIQTMRKTMQDQIKGTSFGWGTQNKIVN